MGVLEGFWGEFECGFLWVCVVLTEEKASGSKKPCLGDLNKKEEE